ncbi:MAG: tRNA guanosine(34) transglycosylase Tgt [Phycisphaerales bacterium]|nr:tRNA guanosine(34) transglycosylase Tgt [Phycisphaerales bacterium]
MRFEIKARSRACGARMGVVHTPHGSFDTPAFMPVGTKASVKGLLPELVRRTGSQIILGNTYHLMLRPGSDVVAHFGGLHRFMRWDGPILTDSGGYQVFSMSDINRITDDGVVFKSIIDGSMVDLTPERSMQVQNELGADIIMAFDDCPPSGPCEDASGAYAARLDIAMERTIAWLERCAASHARPDEQALFGIVQGGTDLDRRRRSVEQVCGIDLPGYAIGGVAVGEGTEEIRRIVEHTAPLLPADRPRYLMGVGYEWDLIMAVRAGVDMFDCVLPTRNGRNANAFTRRGPVRLRNAVHARDESPIEAGCDCPACGESFSRGYLRHLFLAEEMLGPILVSLHNIAHFQRLMADARQAVVDDDWARLTADWPVLGGADVALAEDA